MRKGEGLLDLHTHFVPGVDDGARSLDEAVSFLRQLEADGVDRVVTTPHLPASRVDSGRPARIQRAFRELRERVRDRLDHLDVELSYEIRLDDPTADLSDPDLTLGGGDGLLVEFSRFRVPPPGEDPFDRLHRIGRVPVLAHPERYAGIEQARDRIGAWRDRGVLTCLNVGSLWGRHGGSAQEVALWMLARGAGDLLASDHHGRPGRADSLRPARDLLVEAGHPDAARRLVADNPRAVLAGEAPARVPPVRLPAGRWRAAGERAAEVAG